jgi:hypothetical protein
MVDLQAAVICRAASHVDKYGQCKCVEDALSSIMTDAIQHCLGKEVSSTTGFLGSCRCVEIFLLNTNSFRVIVECFLTV